MESTEISNVKTPKPTDDPAADLVFENSTGFLLARVGAAARRSWARMLIDRDLTPHHYGVLMALDQIGPCGQRHLSEQLGIDPRNVGPLIDTLTERGLIKRKVDPNDRRRRILHLTDAGGVEADELKDTGAELESRFLNHLDPDDQAILHQILLTLWASIGKDQQADALSAT